MEKKKRLKRSITMLLIAVMLLTATVPCFGVDSGYKDILDKTVSSMAAILKKNGAQYGTEWFVMDIARAGAKVSDSFAEEYFAAVEKYVAQTIPTVNVSGAPNALDKNKSTESSRLILTLSSIGRYATDVAGYDLTAPYESFNWIKKQGIMGPVWALIALDTYGYETEDKTIRQQCVDYLLDKQLSDGGWDLANKKADTDVTAMVITSLAPYKDQKAVKIAADKGFDCLSKIQNDDGGFNSWGTNNSESCVQVIVACTSWGIDPGKDSRFVKKGKSAVDNLLSFAVTDSKYGNGFAHVMTDSTSGSYSYTGGEYNSMATEQACYGLIAYDRFLNGKKSLYDMSDVRPFNDISASDNYAKDVWFAYNEGLMSGVGNYCFDPDYGFSRAMVVMVLYNLEGKPNSNVINPFKDVPDKAWYANAVKWAYENKIVGGITDTQFGPDYNITKEEFCAILLTYSRFKGYDISERKEITDFSDYSKCSKWAVDSLKWAYYNGILSLDDGKILNSKGDCTRALSAVFFHRFFEQVIK